MIERLIKGFFVNFSIIFLIASIVIAILKTPSWRESGGSTAVYEGFYRWITLLAAGVVAIYAFILHMFFPNLAAASIGWQNSPFQYEVAIANLGFGVLCILAFKASRGFRVASVTGISLWLWGDAAGHIRQMISSNNFSSGNAGPWFWSDILVPLLLIIFLSLAKIPQEQHQTKTKIKA